MKDLDDVNKGNPFPGLRPFEMEEYHLFFGRDGQSDELLKRLQQTHFVAVVGTSGSGKSSLIRAGLLPALYGGLMAGAGSTWQIVIMRPGHDPLGNLAYELAKIGVLSENSPDPEIQHTFIETALRRSALGLVDVLRQSRNFAPENLLVVVDQFEELFRFKEVSHQTRATDDAAQFVKLLLTASAQTEVPIYVVLTMRSDFLGDCSQFVGLPEAINQAQYLIPRMSRDERNAAITGPIKVAGGDITLPLVNRLLNDVGDNPDQLPILQHALMRTWNYWSNHRRNGQPIGLEDYEAIGAMSEALSQHAEEARAELKDERSQTIAEKLFKRLTERGIDNREIRRPTRLAEICAVAAARPEEVVAVIDVFRRKGRSFLMPPEGIPVTADTIIDISHESLIRNWDALKDWTAEEAEHARLYRRLVDGVKEGDSYLPNSLLDAALEWRDRHKPNAAWAERYHRVSDDPSFGEVMSFIDQSKEARDARIAAETRRAEYEAKRLRQDLENAAALAEKERLLAEERRKSAEEQASAKQRELEQAHVFARKQAAAANRLKILVVALVAILLVAAYAVVAATRAQAKAKESESRAIAALDEANKAKDEAKASEGRAIAARDEANKAKEDAKDSESKALTAKKEAERQKGLASANAKKLETANEGLQIAQRNLRSAVASAQEAAIQARFKEEEAYRLRDAAVKTRDANESYRNGFVSMRQGNFDQAMTEFQKAAGLFTEAKDYSGVGYSYLERAQAPANAYFQTPDDTQVLADYEKAITAFKQAKDVNGEASALASKGEYLIPPFPDNKPELIKRQSEGIGFLQEALGKYKSKGNVEGTLRTLVTLANKLPANETKKVADFYIETLPIYRSRKDWSELKQTLIKLVPLDRDHKDSYIEEMVTLPLAKPDTEEGVMLEAGDLYLSNVNNADDIKKATKYYDQYIVRQSPDSKAYALATIAGKFNGNQDPKIQVLSLPYFQRALEGHIALANATQESETLNNYIAAYEALDRWSEGFAYLERLAASSEPHRKASILTTMAESQKKHGELQSALDAYQRALKIYQVLPKSSELAGTLLKIGTIQLDLKQPSDALTVLKQAQEIFHDLNDAKSATFYFFGEEGAVFSKIGSAQETLKQLPQALESYKKALELYNKDQFAFNYTLDIQAAEAKIAALTASKVKRK